MGCGMRGSVSSLAWFPTELALALTTWDGEVQLLSVQQQQLQVMASYTTGASLAPSGQQPPPILCSVCQGKSVALGSCDGKLRVWAADQGPNAITEWGSHGSPIKQLLLLEPPAWPVAGYLTGSFDKTVALWSQPAPTGQPAAKINLGFKIFAMDGIAPYVLLAGACEGVCVRVRTRRAHIHMHTHPPTYMYACMHACIHRQRPTHGDARPAQGGRAGQCLILAAPGHAFNTSIAARRRAHASEMHARTRTGARATRTHTRHVCRANARVHVCRSTPATRRCSGRRDA